MINELLMFVYIREIDCTSLLKKQKFTANVVVGLLGNKSPDSNRFTLVTPKSENDVRLQATLANQNPTGLPVGTVSVEVV